MQLLKLLILTLLLALFAESSWINSSSEPSRLTEETTSALERELCHDPELSTTYLVNFNSTSDLTHLLSQHTHDKKSYIRLFIYSGYHQICTFSATIGDFPHWEGHLISENRDYYLYLIQSLII